MPKRSLILASASPARLGLLRHAGFDPHVVVSDVDEGQWSEPDPARLAVELAKAKAADVAGRLAPLGLDPDALVIGADSLLDVDGVAHGKPDNVDQARTRLMGLRGRVTHLRTGHCIVNGATGESVATVSSTAVHFGDFDEHELEAYLATGEALRVAGSFTLDGRFAPFVVRIEGDHGTVIGLSLPVVRTLLARLGVAIVDLWI